MKARRMANKPLQIEKFRVTLWIALLAGTLVVALFLPRVDSSYIRVKDAATVTMWSLNGFSLSSLFPFFGDHKSDLSIRIVDAGYMHDGKDAIVHVENTGDRGAIRVTVGNVGDERSGVWILIAKLPITGTNTFISKTQQPIAVGEEKTFLLAFDNLDVDVTKTATLRVEMLDGTEQDLSNNTVQYDFSTLQ